MAPLCVLVSDIEEVSSRPHSFHGVRASGWFLCICFFGCSYFQHRLIFFVNTCCVRWVAQYQNVHCRVQISQKPLSHTPGLSNEKLSWSFWHADLRHRHLPPPLFWGISVSVKKNKTLYLFILLIFFWNPSEQNKPWFKKKEKKKEILIFCCGKTVLYVNVGVVFQTKTSNQIKKEAIWWLEEYMFFSWCSESRSSSMSASYPAWMTGGNSILPWDRDKREMSIHSWQALVLHSISAENSDFVSEKWGNKVLRNFKNPCALYWKSPTTSQCCAYVDRTALCSLDVAQSSIHLASQVRFNPIYSQCCVPLSLFDIWSERIGCYLWCHLLKWIRSTTGAGAGLHKCCMCRLI